MTPREYYDVNNATANPDSVTFLRPGSDAAPKWRPVNQAERTVRVTERRLAGLVLAFAVLASLLAGVAGYMLGFEVRGRVEARVEESKA